MNKERLLNVAKALRESPAPQEFTMYKYGHGCGTPACALGHYAARDDLQDTFALTVSSGCLVLKDDESNYDTLKVTLEHFDITRDQEERLFGIEGCNAARTTTEAAEYIEHFVANAA